MNNYYTYAYLREDGTPYYIGKGRGNRINQDHKYHKPPADINRRIFLKKNLVEEEAFKHEVYMIAIFGRKDLRTGILRNKTNGGEGISGLIVTEEKKEKHRINGLNQSEETRKKISKSMTGKKLSEETKRKLSEVNKGKARNEETRKKIGEFNKGKKMSEDTREKISKKMKEIQSKKVKTFEITFTCGKVMLVNRLYTWAKNNNYSISNLYDLKKGKRKTHKDIVSVKELSTTS